MPAATGCRCRRDVNLCSAAYTQTCKAERVLRLSGRDEKGALWTSPNGFIGRHADWLWRLAWCCSPDRFSPKEKTLERTIRQNFHSSAEKHFPISFLELAETLKSAPNWPKSTSRSAKRMN